MIKNFFFLFFLITLNLFSQTIDSEYYLFELSDSSKLIGSIIFEDENVIQIILLSGGEIRINKQTILSKRKTTYKTAATNIENKEWLGNPNNTRLFFAPTGYGLKSGEVYIALYEIFLPTIAVGIADYFTIVGGVSIYPGPHGQVVYFAPKITPFQNQNFAFSIGGLYLELPNNTPYKINALYGIATTNSTYTSVSLGFGYDTISKSKLLLFGGELWVSERTKIITENFLLLSKLTGYFSLGFRYNADYLVCDFSMVFLRAGFGAIMPWIGFAYNF